jgi:hypothetical protein
MGGLDQLFDPERLRALWDAPAAAGTPEAAAAAGSPGPALDLSAVQLVDTLERSIARGCGAQAKSLEGLMSNLRRSFEERAERPDPEQGPRIAKLLDDLEDILEVMAFQKGGA